MVHKMVSVVVTTANEEKNINNCLQSIKNQTYDAQRTEIIVVDNNSTDKTDELVRKYTTMIYNKGPERSSQRNYGILKAKGEYILFLDADMTLSEKVIGECVAKFINSKLVGLYIPEIILGNSYWCKVRNFERSFYNGTVIDCVRFFPKKVWLDVGGFDENLTGPEDWDFNKKVKALGVVDIIEAPLYHNEADFNLMEYLSGKRYYSKSFEKYKIKWGKEDADIRQQFGWFYRLTVVFIEKGKWKKLIRHPFLSSGIFILRFLVGLTYVKYI